MEQYHQKHTPFYPRRNGIIIIIVIIIIVIGAIVGGVVGGSRSALTAQRASDTTSAAVPSQANTMPTPSATVTLSAPSPICFWKGTAPFCGGICPLGFTNMKEDDCGDGDCCFTGFKVFCCQQ